MKDLKLKRIWLLTFCALVVIMIGLGGGTRLTRSGLSIVEWKPISGWVPPLSEQDWQVQFELYKKSPEFRQVNSHFDVDDYKQIFMWEYLHRVLGRLIFIFALVPGILLWRRKIVEGKLVATLSALVAAQGLIGWLMVKSGLKQDPQVSPYLLGLHFFSALAVLLVAYYHFCKTRKSLLGTFSIQSQVLFYGFGVMLGLQIFWGCLTSGLKAGFAFNTYPLMGGEFFPPGGLIRHPVILNFFENPSAVQWTHRWLGVLCLIYFAAVVFSFSRQPIWKNVRGPMIHLLGVIFSQIVFGVLNILFAVPIFLAIIHQLCAVLIVLTYFSIAFRLREAGNKTKAH